MESQGRLALTRKSGAVNAYKLTQRLTLGTWDAQGTVSDVYVDIVTAQKMQN